MSVRVGFKVPIATIDKRGEEMCPLDIDKILLLQKFMIYEALKMNKLREVELEERGFDSYGHDMTKKTLRKDRIEVINAVRLKIVFDIPVSSREEKDLDRLDSILGRLPLFSKLPANSRYKLYNACKYEVFPRGTILIREGFEAKSCYIVVLGECLVQTNPGQPHSTKHRAKAGNTIGEFSSFGANETRNVRAQCLMRTECLKIDKGDFVTILKEAKQMDLYTVEFLSTVPTFYHIEKSYIVLLSQRSIVRKYDPETLILKAGEEGPNLYFIIRGKVRALHLVTFVKIDEGPMTNSIHRKYSLVPHRGQTLNPGDEIVRELATVTDLSSGSFFPPLVSSKVNGKDIYEEDGAIPETNFYGTNNDSTIEDYTDMIPSPFHFLATEKVELLVISRQDLCSILPVEILRKLSESRAMTDISPQEIQERYLTAQGWRSYENVGGQFGSQEYETYYTESWGNNRKV